MWKYGGVEVHWLGHDGFVLKGTKTVVIDPFKAKGGYTADILLLTHEHYDHMSHEDIPKFVSRSTAVVAPRVCEEGLRKLDLEKVFVQPNSRTVVKGVAIETVPAYNTNKFREPGRVFHPKEEGRVGYVVKLDGQAFYHAGDTDATQEMRSLSVDVAFLPVSGTYVMTAEEAADAAKSMKLKVAVPMHYGTIVGSAADAERFKELVGKSCDVQILSKE